MLEAAGAGAYEPHAPSSLEGGEELDSDLDGEVCLEDMALDEPSAPPPPLGRACAGLSEDVRASAALSRAALSRHLSDHALSEQAVMSTSGRAALARAQGARLKRAASRQEVYVPYEDVEAGLASERRSLEAVHASSLPDLRAGVSTPSCLPGGDALPEENTTPPEEDPHVPAPSARAPSALPRDELQRDAHMAPSHVGAEAPPELVRADSSAHDFSTWSQGRYRGRNSCEGEGDGGRGGGGGVGGGGGEGGGGGGEGGGGGGEDGGGGGEGGGGQSGGGMPPPSRSSSSDRTTSSMSRLRRLGATVRGSASMRTSGCGQPPPVPSSLPDLRAGVSTPSCLPGGDALPEENTTPPEEDPHVPAPSARAPSALPRDELQRDAHMAPSHVGAEAPPELVRADSSAHDFSTWSQGRYRGRNSCEGEGDGGRGGGGGVGGGGGEGGGGGGEGGGGGGEDGGGGGEGGGGQSGGGMPPPSRSSSSDRTTSSMSRLRRLGATVRGSASMRTSGCGQPPPVPTG